MDGDSPKRNRLSIAGLYHAMIHVNGTNEHRTAEPDKLEHWSKHEIAPLKHNPGIRVVQTVSPFESSIIFLLDPRAKIYLLAVFLKANSRFSLFLTIFVQK